LGGCVGCLDLVGAGLSHDQLGGHLLGDADGFDLGFSGGRVGDRLDGLAKSGGDVGSTIIFAGRRREHAH
jgi:hypothetical protein